MQLLKSKKIHLIGVFIIFFVIFLDLYTKELAYNSIHNYSTTNYNINSEIKITSFFSILYVNNNGISFGMFNSISYAKEIFSMLQGLIATFLIIWLLRSNKIHLILALSLIIGGAFGNVIDRIIHGGVTDFLDFYVGSYHWPAFNLADSFIFIGVSILIFDEFYLKKHEKN
jgi:signal peptidase II